MSLSEIDKPAMSGIRDKFEFGGCEHLICDERVTELRDTGSLPPNQRMLRGGSADKLVCNADGEVWI